MPDNFYLNGDSNPIEAYTVDDLHAFLSSYTPAREPGVREVYSNLGVALTSRDWRPAILTSIGQSSQMLSFSASSLVW